jgi:outer membrane cobalamin receptor
MKTFAQTKSLLMGASLAVLASHAYAQAPAGSAVVEEVVVTGSRIVRDGFQAPTPVTTLAADDLAAKAPTNIPDALNQLPQFRGSASNSRSVTWNTNSPNQGNYLNLRNLGTTRSLILLDGVRVPPTSFAGGVDINTLPQALVQRVDVVTGGASAAYGSDAVVGVVNFVLDKAFTGVKANIQAGTSRYADGNSYKVSVAGGTPFLDGRGHIEGSVEAFKQEPIHTFARENGSKFIMRAGRSVNGVQYTHTYEGVRFSNITHGGYILSGPLAGFEFLPGGSVQRMAVGEDIRSSAYRLGGGGAYGTTTP